MTAIGGEIVEREIPRLGTLRFENCEAGEWLTKKGEPAKKPRRRYLLGGVEYDSVSSIVDTLDKAALRAWYEDHGARGAVEAVRRGEITDDMAPEEIVRKVRELQLGADSQRDEAADRGKAIHAGFEAMAKTGVGPKLQDYPEAWRPWVQGAARAWLAMNPEPIETETIVCHPAYRYAGRPDLIAIVNGRRTLIDYKTGKGRVYEQAHYQTRLYAMALEPSGIEPVDDIIIVGIDEEGRVQLVHCEASEADALGLFGVYLSRKRILKGMSAQRAALKRAQEAVAA